VSKIYCVHAASVGKVAMKISRATMDYAVREANYLLSIGHDFVWIDDGRGNIIVPPAEVKACLDESVRAAKRLGT
jgi:hypothetical protein